MKESAHTIGNSVPIFGILTEPDESKLNANKPLVVLVNSGLLGRAGPFRLHVILARELARIGFRTIRIDLSSIGDSGRHRDKRPRVEQHQSDIVAVMDYLDAQLGVTNFILMGICTGADNAHRAMRRNARVVGAVCIDGYSYPTVRYYANKYLPKLVSLKSWKSLLKKVIGRFGMLDKNDNDTAGDQLDYRWELPAIENTKLDYQTFIQRGAKLLCVYTSWKCNYVGQLADAFSPMELGESISAVYLADANHTFRIWEDRMMLVNEITSWMNSNWDSNK